MKLSIFCGIFCFLNTLLFSVIADCDESIIATEKIDIVVNEIHPMIFYCNEKTVNNKIWRLYYDDSNDDNNKIYACVQCVDTDKKNKRIYEIPEAIKKLRLDKTGKYHPFNPPIACTLEISPTGKYFLVKIFSDTSYLYEADTGKLVDIYSEQYNKKTDEVIIGFNKQGDLYCGVQGINPIILLRDITGQKSKEYTFNGLNFPLDGDTVTPTQIEKNDLNEIGMIYNYLSGPIESTDGKYTVFTFTLFQFQNLFAIMLVGDNEKGRIISKQIVDTSNWDICSSKFAFNNDSTKLLFQDGRRKIRLLDLKRGHVTSVFTVPMQVRTNNSVTIANIIDTFFFLPSDEVIVCMQCPRGGYLNLGSMTPPEKPLTLSYLWNVNNNKITSPMWKSSEKYSLKYWLSPDGKTIATFDITFDPRNFMINDRTICKESITFWDVKSSKILCTINGHIESASITDNWNRLELISFDKFPKDINQEIEGVKTMYNIQKLITLHVDKSQISFDKGELPYRDWLSFDGQYSITARLILIDRIDKSTVNKIDLDKLKNTIVTIEKKETKKLVKVFFKNLSQNDQKYILEQIIKQSKQK